MNTRVSTTGPLSSGLLFVGLIAILIGQRILGGVESGVLLTWGGAALVATGFAVRVAAWVRSSGVVRRVESRLIIAQAGVLVALGLYALTTRTGLDLLGTADAEIGRAALIGTVAWVCVMTIAATALAFMEFTYLRMPLAVSVEVGRISAAGRAGVSLACALVFLFSINHIASQKDIRRDLSYLKTTRVGGSTLAMVDRLDTPVRVVLFFPQVNDVLEQIRPYFDELAARSPRLRVEILDHALAPELARDYKVRDNGTVLLVREGDEEAPAIDAKPPAVPKQAGKLASQTIEVGSKLEDARKRLRTLDASFQKAFAQLVQPGRKLYFTTGHREFSEKLAPGDDTGDGLRDMNGVLGRFHVEAETLGAAQGLAADVPAGAGAVAVIGPREPFLAEEADTLLRYVRGGGRLVVMVDPKVDSGLGPLLDGLGLQLHDGVIASKRHFMRRTASNADRSIVYSNRYSSHPTVTSASLNASQVATFVYGAGALERRKGELPPPRPQIVFPLRTAADAWRDLDGDFEQGKDEAAGQQNLIAAVTVPVVARGTVDSGTVDSNGNIPAAGRSAPGESAELAAEGRVVVIGDGDFVTDKLFRNPGNLLIFVDSLRWLIGDEAVSTDLASEEDIPIEHSREADKWWFYLTTFAVPLPLVGVGMWTARRRRRKGGRS